MPAATPNPATAVQLWATLIASTASASSRAAATHDEGVAARVASQSGVGSNLSTGTNRPLSNRWRSVSESSSGKLGSSGSRCTPSSIHSQPGWVAERPVGGGADECAGAPPPSSRSASSALSRRESRWRLRAPRQLRRPEAVAAGSAMYHRSIRPLHSSSHRVLPSDLPSTSATAASSAPLVMLGWSGDK